MEVNNIQAVPPVVAQPVSLPVFPEAVVTAGEKELVAWLNTFVGRDLKVQDLDLISCKQVVWPNAAMGCDVLEEPTASAAMAGYEMRFKYRDHIYVVHSDQAGTRVEIPARAKLVVLQSKVMRGALAHVLELNDPRGQFRIVPRSKFAYDYEGTPGPSIVITCPYTYSVKGGRQHGSYEEIYDLEGNLRFGMGWTNPEKFGFLRRLFG